MERKKNWFKKSEWASAQQTAYYAVVISMRPEVWSNDNEKIWRRASTRRRRYVIVYHTSLSQLRQLKYYNIILSSFPLKRSDEYMQRKYYQRCTFLLCIWYNNEYIYRASWRKHSTYKSAARAACANLYMHNRIMHEIMHCDRPAATLTLE